MFSRSFNKSIFPIFLFMIILSVSCGPVSNRYISHEESHYLKIDDTANWTKIETTLKSGSVIPVELLNEQFCILKESYHNEKRSVGKINYAGLLFYYERANAPTFNNLLSLRKNTELTKKILDIRENLAEQTTINEGIVFILDRQDSLSDSQARTLADAPLTCLMLESLIYISVKQARILSKFKGFSLCLNRILWIGKDHCTALAQFHGRYLGLNSIQTLSRGQAKALCRFKGNKLFLQNLYKESKEIIYQYEHESVATIVTSTDN